MTGPLLAAFAGLGFGVFQSLNRRAVGGMSDPYFATFLQLLIALCVLAVATLATTDPGVLRSAGAVAIGCFVLAGLVHFFLGWTLLNMSQMRIGASRTSPLLSTNPVFGAAIAAATLREVPTAAAWLGIAVVLAGALLVSLERVGAGGLSLGLRDASFGLGTALAWSVSPILIKRGLEGLSSPLLGLTLGMLTAVAAYAVLVGVRALPTRRDVGSPDALAFKLAAGLMVGLSVWARWASLDSAGVAVVLALGLLSVPVVLVLSPLLVGRHVERVTAGVWAGGGLVVAGGLLLVVAA